MKNPLSILVTGGCGYVGSILVKKLVDEGFNVKVIDSLIFGKDSIEKLIENKSIHLANLDLRDTQKIKSELIGVDSVIHLAAIVGEPLCKKIPESALQINEFASKNLASLAKKAGVKRFIFASTCSNYGSSSEIVDETSSTQPLSLYSKTKVNSENFILSLEDDHFEPCIFRFATAHGLSPRMRFDLLLQELLRDALVDKKITLFGANFWRPLIHVNDMAAACLTAISSSRDKISGQIYNVGSDKENYTKLELAKIIQEFLPSVEIEIIESKKDPRNYKVSFEKIKNNLNFSAQFSVKDSISQILNEINENNLDPRDSEFSNISKMTEQVKLFDNYDFDENL
ncbi:SDR family oxidoreductase [Candidatus Nitrosopelagicus sp.]|nr:SDR family oxidoreductase [Candidatus Nitrosopelagicus sp.]